MSLIPGDAKDRQGREFIAAAHIPVVCVSGFLQGEEISELINETRVKWFFHKRMLSKERANFLDAIELAMVISKAEISARWKAIERTLLKGD